MGKSRPMVIQSRRQCLQIKQEHTEFIPVNRKIW